MVVIIIFVILFSPQLSIARVKGVCSNCHTMHNYQGGEVISGNTTYALLKATCIGCHSNTGSSTIVTIGETKIPIVYNKQEPENPLAGGNFFWVANNYLLGHNVYEITDTDDKLGNSPPGYNSDYDPAATDFNTSIRLTCAGSNGCHGNRDIATDSLDYWKSMLLAIRGAHHEDDSCLKFGSIDESEQGETVGKSYRFLYKVHGGEDSDWQQTKSASDHNEYKGEVFSTRTGLSWDNVDTISELCAECHGYFHMSGSEGIGTQNPWLRHPTDVVIPNSGEFQNAFGSSNEYDPLVPVGRQSIPNSPSSAVNIGSDTVLCISCHRAHGSPYSDMLRWDYIGWPAGGGENGCVVCHTYKD